MTIFSMPFDRLHRNRAIVGMQRKESTCVDARSKYQAKCAIIERENHFEWQLSSESSEARSNRTERALPMNLAHNYPGYLILFCVSRSFDADDFIQRVTEYDIGSFFFVSHLDWDFGALILLFKFGSGAAEGDMQTKTSQSYFWLTRGELPADIRNRAQKGVSEAFPRTQ